MPFAPLDLSEPQRDAAGAAGGALLVLGGPGAGKTATLVERCRRLAADGHSRGVVVLTTGIGALRQLRAAIDEAAGTAADEMAVATPEELCATILLARPGAAGLDPFALGATHADRLALLLDAIDELPLRQHDLGGSPAALLAGVLERIDRLKEELVDAERFAAWAQTLAADDDAAAARAAREREFAALYAAHERLLAQAGAVDGGGMLLRAIDLLREGADARAELVAGLHELLIDDLHDLTPAQCELARLLAARSAGLFATTLDRAAPGEGRGDVRARFAALPPAAAAVRTIELAGSRRCPPRVLAAADAALGLDAAGAANAASGGELAFWRCAGERAQAQAVAADVERLLASGAATPESIAVIVRSVRNEGQAIAFALDERAVPHALVGAGALYQHAEVRDVLAWLRLLGDPGDASAVVRALARPPIELRSIDLARCIQIARRRKLDMVSGLVAATESPQLPPEARDRVLAFLKLHRSAAASLDRLRPDVFVHRLIERLGLRRQQLFAAQADVVQRLRNLARLAAIAAGYAQRAPRSTARDFGRYVTAVADAGLGAEEEPADTPASAVRVLSLQDAKGLALDHVYVLGLQSARMPGAREPGAEPAPAELRALRPAGEGDAAAFDARAAHVATMRRLLHLAMTRARRRLVLCYPSADAAGGALRPSPFVELARAAVEGEWETREEELFGPAETLHATLRSLRDELLQTLPRLGGRLGELRLDADLDVSHAIVRYVELLKLAAVVQRPDEQRLADALADLNARLAGALTAEQREILASSGLDEHLLDSERSDRRRAKAVAARDEPSLEQFLRRRGDGLVLSASDIETYRTCPLKYKFARVLRIPVEPTLNQRFGIFVHQVLERFHAPEHPGTLADMLGLVEAGWRRAGFSDSDEERQLRAKAVEALTRYHGRFAVEPAEPVWFERSFSFKLGRHLVRGRVDRVDRLPSGGYELIDYKTGRPKTPAQLAQDVQLALYAVGAREAWELNAESQAYYYVLDDEKVPVSRDRSDPEWVTETVSKVAEGIMGQGFEPTPSYAACSVCDYRLVCPAAER